MPTSPIRRPTQRAIELCTGAVQARRDGSHGVLSRKLRVCLAQSHERIPFQSRHPQVGGAQHYPVQPRRNQGGTWRCRHGGVAGVQISRSCWCLRRPSPAPPHPLPTAPAWQALLPVGEPSDADFRKFASLITRHRQVGEGEGSMACTSVCLWTASLLGCQSSHATQPVLWPRFTGQAQQCAHVPPRGAQEPLQAHSLENRAHEL